MGWDWIGINLDDGGALMAFRMRDKRGGRLLGGRLAAPSGRPPRRLLSTGGGLCPGPHLAVGAHRNLLSGVVAGESRRAGARHRAALRRPGARHARVDSGAIYWEGAARAMVGGKPVGRGYLELTGYGKRLQL